MPTSRLGVGIMRWPDKPDHRTAIDYVDYAMSHGVNYFETCMFYNDWKCEQILAALLQKYPRDSYELCGKMAVHGVLDRKHNLDFLFQKQLNNCKTDYFDYYLVQCVDRSCLATIKESNLLPFLHEKRQQGIIKKLGFSFHDDVDVLYDFLVTTDWDVVQLQLNYVDWYINNHRALYDILTEKNIPIIVMGAHKGGQLTHHMPENIKAIVAKEYPDINLSQLALEFLMRLDNVERVLCGTASLEEFQENVKFGKCVKWDERKILLCEDIAASYAASKIIPCTQCGYCDGKCVNGVEFRKLFGLYNQLLSKYDIDTKREYLDTQFGRHGWNSCTRCGKCSKHCPQHIDIPQTLAGIGQYYR